MSPEPHQEHGSSLPEPGEGSEASAETEEEQRLKRDELLEPLSPTVAEKHRSTLGVLVLTFVAGRLLESWLSDLLAPRQLDPSSYAALISLWLSGPPHRLNAGELATRVVQSSGGATKTVQRLADRGLVRRVADPEDRRRNLYQLTPAGFRLAHETLGFVLEAFDAEIEGLDDPTRDEGDCFAHNSRSRDKRAHEPLTSATTLFERCSGWCRLWSRSCKSHSASSRPRCLLAAPPRLLLWLRQSWQLSGLGPLRR